MNAEPRIGPVIPFFGTQEWEPGGVKMAVFTCGRPDCERMFCMRFDNAIEYRGTQRACPHCFRVSLVSGSFGMSEEDVEEFKRAHGDAAALARAED